MADSYSVEPDGLGAYLVRVTHPEGGGFVIGGFPTWEEATEWINSARLALLSRLNGTALHPSAWSRH